MKKFIQKQREILAILLYVVIVLSVIYFAILPLMAKISTVNYQIQEEEMNQEIVTQYVNDLPKIQKQYEELQRSGDLNDVLLDKNKAVTLIEKLEKMAQETNNGINIEVQAAVDPKKVAVKGKAVAENELIAELPSPDYLQLKISLVGKYASIDNFIQSLEKFEYYCDITAIQINKNEDNSSLGSTKSIRDVGVNPFVSEGNVIDNAKIKKIENDVLSASLFVVFYAKQN